MIIVSQDKKTIINCENVFSISVYDLTCNIQILVTSPNGEVYKLGNYKTTSRAKQVMKEIEDLVSIDKFSNVTDKDIDLALKVRELTKYEMPEK